MNHATQAFRRRRPDFRKLHDANTAASSRAARPFRRQVSTESDSTSRRDEYASADHQGDRQHRRGTRRKLEGVNAGEFVKTVAEWTMRCAPTLALPPQPSRDAGATEACHHKATGATPRRAPYEAASVDCGVHLHVRRPAPSPPTAECQHRHGRSAASTSRELVGGCLLQLSGREPAYAGSVFGRIAGNGRERGAELSGVARGLIEPLPADECGDFVVSVPRPSWLYARTARQQRRALASGRGTPVAAGLRKPRDRPPVPPPSRHPRGSGSSTPPGQPVRTAPGCQRLNIHTARLTQC